MKVSEIQLLVFVSTLIVLFLAIVLLFFFSYFQQKKTAYLLKQKEIQQKFDEEITKSKLEIQEQALQNISWEIHDNIGQLLSVAKMQLNLVQMEIPTSQSEKVKETSSIVGKSLEELRSLAKSLNPDSIKNRGLKESVLNEIERYNRLNVISAKLECSGSEYAISNEKEIILFRIIQEFCNNTLKHAQANNLTILLNYLPHELIIELHDDGIGFDLENPLVNKGIGLFTMKSRTDLINATYQLTSKPNVGTKLRIKCPK